MWTPDLAYNALPPLPPLDGLLTPAVLKKAIEANRLLGELKGLCQVLPRSRVLLDTVIIQESRDSSAIENIVTTQDELYRAVLDQQEIENAPAREVLMYRQAVYAGLQELERVDAITRNLAIRLFQVVKSSTGGIRRVPGTVLANPVTKQVVYTPPSPEFLDGLLDNWEHFANTDDDVDALIRMAILHYQFEAIHPFIDGNGRVGRILNLLFLVQRNLLPEPILYLSSHIHQHRPTYYTLLRKVSSDGDWESWILFMLSALADTSRRTLELIHGIRALMQQSVEEMKGISQKMPVHELTELIFSFPYVQIKTLEKHGLAKRQTAANYLNSLVKKGLLITNRTGRDTYYVNQRLLNLLSGNNLETLQV